jgi:lipopolysaccharide transport system ATP-binding protein
LCEPLIELEHVTKEYRLRGDPRAGLKNVLLRLPDHLRGAMRRHTLCALSDVSLAVPRGECLGIIGVNGSGKSTALGLMAGVLRPTAGTVRTRGRICPLLELGAGFHPELTGIENICLNAVLLGLTRAEVRERADDIIAFSGLGEFVARPVRVYSSGMVARLAFSVAVHIDPEILLVDEMLSVGDLAFQHKCLKRMRAFLDEGKTMVFVSHNMTAVEAVCTRAAWLDDGRLVDVGEPAAIAAAYARRLGS